MANITFRDGSQPFVNMVLKNSENPRAGKEGTDLAIMGNHLMDFQFTEQHGRTATFNLTLFDASFDAIENVIFTGGYLEPSNNKDRTSHPVLTVKWGWHTHNEKDLEAPHWDMHIAKYSSKFTYGKGTTITMEGWAAPGLITTRGWRVAGPAYVDLAGGKSVTLPNNAQTKTTGTRFSTLKGLVDDIAKANGMTADVEDAKITRTITQNGKSDFMWLKYLIKYALKPGSGNKHYKVWVRNTVSGKQELVVKSNKYDQGTDTIWDYLYGVDRDSQVLEYETNINSMVLFGLGGGGFKSVILDPLDKEFKTLYVDESTITGTAGEGKYIPQGSVTKAPLRVGYQDEEAARLFAEHKFLELSMTNVTATLIVMGNPLIGPTDLVNVVVLRKGNTINSISDIHPASGSWNITRITHLISNGSYVTELELHRRGNLTKGAGGTNRTTGTEAAINQVDRASVFAKDLDRREATKRKKSEKLKSKETGGLFGGLFGGN